MERSAIPKLGINSLWSFLGAAVSQATSLFISLFVGNALGAAALGQLGYVRSTVAQTAQVLSLGLDVAATKYISQYKVGEKTRSYAFFEAVVRLVIFILSILTSIYLALTWLWIDADLDYPYLDLMNFAVPLLGATILVILFRSVLVGLSEFKRISLSEVLFSFISLIICISLGLFYGVYAVVVGLAIATLIFGILLFFQIKKSFKLMGVDKSPRNNGVRSAAIRELLAFGIPVCLGGVAVSVAVWYCNTVLLATPNGEVEMGYFSMALQWKALIFMAPMMAGGPLLPVLTELHVKREHSLYVQTFIKYKLIICGVVALVGGAIIMFSDLVVKMYGADFVEAEDVLVLSCVGSMIQSSAWFFSRVIMSLGLTQFSMFINVLWAASLVYIYSGLVGSAYALAYAFVCAGAIQWVICAVCFVVYFYLKLREN